MLDHSVEGREVEYLERKRDPSSILQSVDTLERRLIAEFHTCLNGCPLPNVLSALSRFLTIIGCSTAMISVGGTDNFGSWSSRTRGRSVAEGILALSIERMSIF